MMYLNDGIYHPYYNSSGWRKRWYAGNGYLWNETVAGLKTLANTKDCFDIMLINNDDVTSGRPDGLVLVNDGTSSPAITEWE